ncbi:MAG TPA: hypothetical protein VEU33_13970 [Archangium sp.]|nr:hypothetical protein [Archangium sp.]
MTIPPSAPFRLSLLLLLLLTPGVGLAAPEAPREPLARDAVLSEPLLASSGLPGTDARAPLRLREGDPSWREGENARPPTALRILAQTGAGLLLGVGGGYGGFLGSLGLCGLGGGGFGCLYSSIGGMLLGGGLGLALGVWGTGELMGGTGSMLGALAGLSVGLAASLVVGLIVGLAVSPLAGLVLAVPLSLAGTIVGYELSQPEPALDAAPRAPAVSSARPRLHPVLAFSPRSTVVGVGGTF